MAKRMLIVVDETVTARWLPGHFEADGWDVIRAGDEASALSDSFKVAVFTFQETGPGESENRFRSAACRR